MNKRAKVEFYKNKRNLWSWRLKAPNGRIIAVPGEDFNNKVDAVSNFHMVANYSSEAQIRFFNKTKE